MTEKAIRSNWMLALSKEECISPTIEWAFHFQDLIVLGAIHRSGIFREKSKTFWKIATSIRSADC